MFWVSISKKAFHIICHCLATSPFLINLSTFRLLSSGPLSSLLLCYFSLEDLRLLWLQKNCQYLLSPQHCFLLTARCATCDFDLRLFIKKKILLIDSDCYSLDLKCPPNAYVAWFPNASMSRGGVLGKWLDRKGSDFIGGLIHWKLTGLLGSGGNYWQVGHSCRK